MYPISVKHAQNQHALSKLENINTCSNEWVYKLAKLPWDFLGVQLVILKQVEI